MTKEGIRLEVLKLAFRHDRPAAEVVNVAKVLEEYVSEHLAEPTKKIDKPDKSDKSDVEEKVRVKTKHKSSSHSLSAEDPFA